jgi:hypothetical protein
MVNVWNMGQKIHLRFRKILLTHKRRRKLRLVSIYPSIPGWSSTQPCWRSLKGRWWWTLSQKCIGSNITWTGKPRILTSHHDTLTSLKKQQTSTKHDISSVYKDFKSTNLNHSKILPKTKNTQTPDILMKFFAERL